jgi:hypothetical protein
MFRYYMLNLQVKLCATGKLKILFGLVKILKHSARLSLLVIKGSKSISLSFSLAIRFVAFWPGVSEKFP